MRRERWRANADLHINDQTNATVVVLVGWVV